MLRAYFIPLKAIQKNERDNLLFDLLSTRRILSGIMAMISSRRDMFSIRFGETRGNKSERRKEMKRERRTHRRNVIGSVVFATGAADLFVAEYASDLVPRSLVYPILVRFPFPLDFLSRGYSDAHSAY